MNSVFWGAPESAYIHIPYCRSKCHYCDFNSYAHQQGQEAYVQALLDAIAYQKRRYEEASPAQPVCALKSVYFGGGTPTVLSTEALISILRLLETCFGFQNGAEITIEANPGTVTEAGLGRLREAGFNRLSVGVQSLEPKLLQILGRTHTAQEALEAIAMAKRCGFEAISADVMIHLPSEDRQDYEQTVMRLSQTPITHLSVYPLMVEEGTRFWSLYGPAGKSTLLPNERQEQEAWQWLDERLPILGFERYEIANYARNGSYSKHNLAYWNAKSYWGFGAGAHSFVSGERHSSLLNPQDYVRQVKGLITAYEAGGDASTRNYEEQLWPLEEVIGFYEAQLEYVMLRLRLAEGLSASAYRTQFGRSWSSEIDLKLKRFWRDGLLDQRGDGYTLSDIGRRVANKVFSAFV